MPDRFASISTLLPTRPAAEPVRTRQSDAAPAASSPEASAPVAASSGPRAVPPRTRTPRRTATEQPRTRASDAADGGPGGSRSGSTRACTNSSASAPRRLGPARATSSSTPSRTPTMPARSRHAAPQPARTGLFARTQDRGPAAPTVLVEIRLTSQAVQTLDQLVARTKQPTRTQLIHAALDHHFRQAGEGQRSPRAPEALDRKPDG